MIFLLDRTRVLPAAYFFAAALFTLVVSPDNTESENVPRVKEGIANQPRPACITLTSDGTMQRSLIIAPGGTLGLRFQHSIYRSYVEEVFLIRTNGFELAQLRYDEARLVEFYGYEKSTIENAAWLVQPPPTVFPALNLQSSDASMSLHLADSERAQTITLEPDSAIQLTVGPCRY